MSDGAPKKSSARTTMTVKRRRKRTSVVLRAGVVEIRADVGRERRRCEHARGGSPPKNPAAEREIVADLQRQHDATVGAVTQRLRRVPHTSPNVRRHSFVEGDFHMRRWSRVHAERVAKHIVWDRARRRERLFLERHRRNPVDREGAYI